VVFSPVICYVFIFRITTNCLLMFMHIRLICPTIKFTYLLIYSFRQSAVTTNRRATALILVGRPITTVCENFDTVCPDNGVRIGIRLETISFKKSPNVLPFLGFW